MSIKTFCDICKKELIHNVVNEQLSVTSGQFTARVIISKDDVQNEGDLCLECLMKMLNQKPKRKYTRKEKSIAEQSQEISTTPIEEK